MLKSKIKISDITHLTDARYFAAWGVDYLTFNIDPESSTFVSPPVFKEIVEWVAGPSIVLQAPAHVEEIWLQEYKIEGIDNLLEMPADEEGVSYIFKDDTLVSVIIKGDLNQITESHISTYIDRGTEVYIDAPVTKDDLQSVADLGVGLVLRGGEEEQVGVKSYEDLDEIFEALVD